jgi:hypothetical protein
LRCFPDWNSYCRVKWTIIQVSYLTFTLLFRNLHQCVMSTAIESLFFHITYMSFLSFVHFYWFKEVTEWLHISLMSAKVVFFLKLFIKFTSCTNSQLISFESWLTYMFVWLLTNFYTRDNRKQGLKVLWIQIPRFDFWLCHWLHSKLGQVIQSLYTLIFSSVKWQ